MEAVRQIGGRLHNGLVQRNLQLKGRYLGEKDGEIGSEIFGEEVKVCVAARAKGLLGAERCECFASPFATAFYIYGMVRWGNSVMYV